MDSASPVMLESDKWEKEQQVSLGIYSRLLGFTNGGDKAKLSPQVECAAYWYDNCLKAAVDDGSEGPISKRGS